ncbi:MAG TPA: ATP-binding protein [Candidatus Binatia bacterium]|nr:ATP-binding protein [Candidatus Binatia bacterium]
MRLFSLRRDLGLRLLALNVLFIALVVAGTLLFENFATQRLEADVKAADQALARAIAQETNITMENALQAVRQLAGYEAVTNMDQAGMDELFATLLSVRSDVNLIYRLDKTGLMVFHYPVGPESTVGVDFSFRKYFQRARQTQDPLMSEGRISPTTNQPVATAVMPIWNNAGDFDGVVATNLKLETLSRTLAGIAREYVPSERFNILIVDAAGQIIANPTPELLLADASTVMPAAVFDALVQRQSGSLISSAGDGEDMLYSYVPVNSVGWGVVVSRPTAVAFATPTLFQRGAVLAIVVFLLGGSLFWVGLSRYFVRPLERLTAFSQSIAAREPFSEEQHAELDQFARRPDQIGYLTRSMQRMQQSVEARLDELSTLLQTSAAVVSTLELQTVLDRILEEVEHLLGVQMCAIYALDEVQGTFRIQASRGLEESYTLGTAIDPGDHESVTMRAIHNGKPVQVSDTETSPSFAIRRVRARAGGYRSVLGVPLNTTYAPPSALLVFRPDAHVFSEREIDLLASFANHAAMAIENATLYTRSDMRLQEQTRRLEALIQSMKDGLILEDLDGRVLYANRRIEQLSGLAGASIRQASVDELMTAIVSQAKDPQAAMLALRESTEENGSRQSEFALNLPSGTCHLRIRVFDVTDAGNVPIGRGRVLQDITQRRRLDRMKSSLISTVSHELRTPLAAIKGYASTLLAEDVEWDRQSQREFLTVISDETDHLSELVNDLLDMSRIEAGNLEVRRQTCDLRELVEQAAQRAHPQPGENLHMLLPENLPTLIADPQRIEVVLRNLIENAAKYSNGNGPITVRARWDESEIIVCVEDEGPGIPSEHSEHIFDSFYRVEDGLTRTQAGAGLGLAIAQGFVRAHGGEIWIEPRTSGTAVAFSLPLNGVDA